MYRNTNTKGSNTATRDKATAKAIHWTLKSGINKTAKGKNKPGIGTGIQQGES
jgi:hypothetical protein